MIKRKYILAAAVLAAVMMTAGCAGNNDKKTEKTENADSPQDTASTDDVLDFDVAEYVKLGDYKGLEVTYPSVEEVTQEEVEEYIQETLAENVELKEVDRASKEEDVLNIDYTGTIDGEEFEGGSETDSELQLGAGDFLPEFEENLVGKKAGETVVFTMTFPEDYDEELAGKEAEFTVKVNSVSKQVEPKYNVDFVKSVSDYETLEDYEASVKKELEEGAKSDSEMEAGDHALRLVTEQAEIKGYPQELYDFFYEDNVSGYQAFAEMQGMEYEEFLETFMSEEDIKEMVEEQVNNYLISQAVLKQEGVELTDQEYSKMAEKLAKDNDYESVEEFEEGFGEVNVKTEVVREKAIELLKEAVTLKEIPSDEYYEEEEDLELDEEEE